MLIIGNKCFSVIGNTANGIITAHACSFQFAVIPQVSARIAQRSPSTSAVLIEHPVPIGAAHLIPAEADGLSSLVKRRDVDMGRRTAPTRAHAAFGANRRRRRGLTVAADAGRAAKEVNATETSSIKLIRAFVMLFLFILNLPFTKIKAEVALCRSIKLFGFLNHMYHQHLS